MGIWERRLFGIAALGGSFTGLAAGGTLVASELSGLAKLFVVPFLGLYLWGIWCGLRMIEVGDGALRANRWFWLAQVPMFMTPWLGYKFTSGLVGWLAFKAPMQWQVQGRFGSEFEYSILEGKPLMLGINVVALAAWWWLGRRLRQSQVAAVVPAEPPCDGATQTAALRLRP
jgi:hypothetical protein